MARRRSILGDVWLQLTLQAALAVGAAHAAAVAPAQFSQHAFLSTAANDAFVLVSGAPELAPLPSPSFENFSMAFYLPPDSRAYDDHVVLPDLDVALLGGPERTYDWHADDFLL